MDPATKRREALIKATTRTKKSSIKTFQNIMLSGRSQTKEHIV